MAGVIKNIVTFGAAGRVDAAHERLLEHQQRLEELHAAVDSKRTAANGALEVLVAKKVAGIAALKRLTQLSSNLSIKDRELGERRVGTETFSLVSLDDVQATISSGDAAINAAKGLSAGASTALGAWALVTTFGSASTGTAIASLSGAAATKAALAWFGGGAVAAGGGGIAAGAAVIGGVVAVPALILTAAFSHVSANKRIKEMREHELELIEATEEYEKAGLVLELCLKRSAELEWATAKATEAFEIEFEKVRRRLYPWGWLSKVVRAVRRFFGGRYFRENEVAEIAYIGQVGARLARVIDLKVFDATGEVTKGIPQ